MLLYSLPQRNFSYIGEKSAEKRSERGHIHWRLDSSKPFPQKQNRSAHVKLSQARTVLTQSARLNATDSNDDSNLIMEFAGDDVLLAIFSFLDIEALCIANQVCRQWKRISDFNALWPLWKSQVRQSLSSTQTLSSFGKRGRLENSLCATYYRRLYPRSTVKRERKIGYDALASMLIPVEEGKFVELTIKKRPPISFNAKGTTTWLDR